MAESNQSQARTSRVGFAAVAAVERHEIPVVVAAFFLFFCVLGGYFAVRPVRDTVGTIIGRDRVADLWIATWAASLAIVPIYGAVVARVRRSIFLPWTYGLVALSLALVGLAFRDNDTSIAVGQFFYVFISVLSLFLPSVFWSFILEFVDTGQAKRLFPVIAAGGTAGALLGPLITDVTVTRIGNGGVLFLGAAMFGVAIACQRILLRLWANGHGHNPARGERASLDRPIGGNPIAGLWIVLRSPYLLGIALFVTLLSTASTFLYFEQLRLVDLTFPDPATRTRVFARMDWIVQSLTIVGQLFITGRIAQRLGLVVLLSMVPIAMVFGFFALAVWNTFTVLAVVFIGRRVGEYAFVRPAREMLWSPLDREAKYKAKNFVDVPIYRGADALVAQVQQAVGRAGFGPQVIAMLGVVCCAAWAINGWWLGRRHDHALASGASPADAETKPSVTRLGDQGGLRGTAPGGVGRQ